MNVLGIYGAWDWQPKPEYDEQLGETWIHDAGVTLFKDGQHIASISEERLSRKKYDGSTPVNSMNYCLQQGNLKPEDIDLVCIPGMCIDIYYQKYFTKTIERIVNKIFPNAKIKYLSHHYCHAMASIYSSDFDEGCFLTLDGSGSLIYEIFSNEPHGHEVSSFGYFNKKEKSIQFFKTLDNTNPFGNFYSAWSQRIYNSIQRGLSETPLQKNVKLTPTNRESAPGKIMGLSAYGEHEIDWSKFKMFDKLNEEYETIPHVVFKHFGSMMDHYQQDILIHPEKFAYILQRNFEEAMMYLLNSLKENGYLKNKMCFSGGSFLNVLTNSIIKQSGLFEDIHVPPYPNDTGLHFGAAAWGAMKFEEEVSVPHNIALLGKEYSDEEIETALKESGLKYEKHDFDTLCEKVSVDLRDNKIVGWFQGRSEFGPRALGSRSIFMNPSPAENKDLINDRIKHREMWRPFAGIILKDYLSEYFHETFESPYMLYSHTAKDEKIPEIAAITHVDKTCRIQTITHENNAYANKLLEHYHKLTGTPVILNTSFNDNGEPIVEKPEDAIRAFNNVDIDVLAIGNFIVRKDEQIRTDNNQEPNL